MDFNGFGEVSRKLSEFNLNLKALFTCLEEFRPGFKPSFGNFKS